MDDEPEDITEITDRSMLESLTKDMLLWAEGREALSRAKIGRRGDVIVPYRTDGAHLTDEEGSQLLRLARHAGWNSAYVLVLEEFPKLNTAFEIKMTKKGIAEVCWACGLLYFLLLPRGAEFAVLCDVEGFSLVGGRQEIVEDYLGKSLVQAQLDFIECIKTAGDELSEAFFTEVKEYYIDPVPPSREGVQ